MTKLFNSNCDFLEPVRNDGHIVRTRSSSSVANKLYNSGHQRKGSVGSDVEMFGFSDTEIHCEINDISSQVSTINRKLTEMEEIQLSSGEEKVRLRTDNAVLQERTHILEEQFQTMDESWREKLLEERSRNRELRSRIEREKDLELESWSLKYQVLEKDHESCANERVRMSAENRRLRNEIEHLVDKVAESKMLVDHLEEERVKIERDHRRYRLEAQQDIDSSTEMVEELSRQTDELKQQRQIWPRKASLAEQLLELEEELARVQEENRALITSNEDMQAQLLDSSFEQGRALLKIDGVSLAEELVVKDSTQLMSALKDQEVCNLKLRTYINDILLRVIDRHPEILEIKSEEQSPPSID